MKTLLKAECYILRRGWDNTPVPAKVIRETVSTVTVVSLSNETGEPIPDSEYTFQKTKRYGGDYVNPRDTNEPYIYQRGGYGSVYSRDRLTFQVEKTVAQYEEEQYQKALNKRANEVYERVSRVFQSRHGQFSNTPENLAKLEALEKLFPAPVGIGDNGIVV